MKFKIVSMLVVLGLLSVLPLIYTGKLDPATFFNQVSLNSDQLNSGISELKKAVPTVDAGSEVTVYKWQDANGTVQFGSHPPPGAAARQVSVDMNQNVMRAVKVPVKEEAPSNQTAQEVKAPSPYSVNGMKKVLDDARGVEDMLKKSHQEREKMMKNL